MDEVGPAQVIFLWLMTASIADLVDYVPGPGMRDRLGVYSAVHFGAQLPELLRGLYYNGLDPGRVPVKFGTDEYLRRFAQEVRIPPEEVGAVAAAVTVALREQVSPGQLDGALARLPAGLRGRLVGGPDVASATPEVRAPLTPPISRNGPSVDQRVDKLEARVAAHAEALRVLAHGLATTPGAEPHEQRGPRAARQTYEILLTEPS